MSVSVLNTDASLSGKTLMAKEVSETVSGVKTFSVAQVFSAAPQVNAGLQFPATQVTSADANNLDDYEEGTFTPTLVSTGGGTPTYAFQVGLYTKVGRQVSFTSRTNLATIGTLAAGTITMAGLPFTSNATTQSHAPIFVGFFGGMTSTFVSMGGFITAATTSINLYRLTAAATGMSVLTQADLGAASDIIVGGTYFV